MDISTTTVRRLIAGGVLPDTQPAMGAPGHPAKIDLAERVGT